MLRRAVEIMKRELIAGLIIIIIIVLIAGCGPSTSGGGSGGGYDSPEREEARDKINHVEGMIDDCEIVIETAEKVGVKSSLIIPAREDLINAKKRLRDADNKYESSNYNGAKLDAESAESYIKSAREYAEGQIKQLRDEVRTVLKETEADVTSSENYIISNSDLGNNTITAMEMINFAKDEIESAWTKYDEEKYGVALKKSEQARSYSFEAKNMVELVVKDLTIKTINIATADLHTAIRRIKVVIEAGVSIPSAKSKLNDSSHHLKMAEDNYKQGEYEKAQENAVEASRLSLDSIDDADRRLEFFVESNLDELLMDIRDMEDKIEEIGHRPGVLTYSEEAKLEDVKDMQLEAESDKNSGDLLSAAQCITNEKTSLEHIDHSLNEKKGRSDGSFLTAVFLVLFTICIFAVFVSMKRRGK